MRSAPVVLALALAGPLPAQTLHYEGGAGLATGTYLLTSRTSSWSVSTGLACNLGPVTLRASVPLLYQSTASIAGAGSRWAAADPFVSATLSGFRTAGLSLLLGVTAKVPMVDTASYGSGAWDVGGGASLAVALGPRVVLGADAGYWVMGDAPGLPLSNTVLFGSTLSYLALRGWGLSAGISGATPAIAGWASSVSAVASVLRFGGPASVGLLASVGLTETAPDVSVSITWRVALLR